MSGNLEIYVSAFDSSLTANAAELPATIVDTFGSYDVVFNTSLPASSMNMITFTRTGDDLTINSDTFNQSASYQGFSVPGSVFHAIGSNGDGAYFSVKNGIQAGTAPYLIDDYLGYIAKKELGSQYLVGAFQNVTDIVSPISDSVVLDAMSAALANKSYQIPQFMENEITPDDSALWVIYSAVFDDYTDRLTDSADGVTTPLLKAGDVIVIKLTISTPELDSSITAYGPDIIADSPGSPFVPVKPADRIYKLRITLV
jgi:hypothetical protein